MLKIREFNTVILLLFFKITSSGNDVVYFRKILGKVLLVLHNLGGVWQLLVLKVFYIPSKTHFWIFIRCSFVLQGECNSRPTFFRSATLKWKETLLSRKRPFVGRCCYVCTPQSRVRRLWTGLCLTITHSCSVMKFSVVFLLSKLRSQYSYLINKYNFSPLFVVVELLDDTDQTYCDILSPAFQCRLIPCTKLASLSELALGNCIGKIICSTR